MSGSVGVFDRVIISFLPVGHTHEDIGKHTEITYIFSIFFFFFFSYFFRFKLFFFCLDQFFSKLAAWLRTHATHDRNGVLNGARQGFRPWWAENVTKAENMETAANFSQWIKPFLNNFPQITKPKQF